MRNWNMLLLTAALVARPACAVDAPRNVSVLSATGDGHWEMICHVNTEGGDEMPRILDSSKSSMSVTGMWSGSCSFSKPGKMPLTISIESTTVACPFKAAAPDACKQTFDKGSAGSFDIKPKRAH